MAFKAWISKRWARQSRSVFLQALSSRRRGALPFREIPFQFSKKDDFIWNHRIGFNWTLLWTLFGRSSGEPLRKCGVVASGYIERGPVLNHTVWYTRCTQVIAENPKIWITLKTAEWLSFLAWIEHLSSGQFRMNVALKRKVRALSYSGPRFSRTLAFLPQVSAGPARIPMKSFPYLTGQLYGRIY